MVIRRLTKADASAYHALRLQALAAHPEAFTSSPEQERLKPATWAEERLCVSSSNPHGFVLGALSGSGELVGYVGLKTAARLKVRHKGGLYSMYVSKTYAGKGIGTALVQRCIAEARKIPHLEQLTLTVTSTNQRAIRLYEAHGFKTFGVEPKALKQDGGYLDKTYMVLFLHETSHEE